MTDTFTLRILATDRPFFEGECLSLVVPTASGQYGILAHHCNYVAAIVPGELDFTAVHDGMSERFRAAVSEGIVKVESNEVIVLVDTAERPEEIDEARARSDADAALEQRRPRAALPPPKPHRVLRRSSTTCKSNEPLKSYPE